MSKRGTAGTPDPRNHAGFGLVRGSRWAVLGSNRSHQLVELGSPVARQRAEAAANDRLVACSARPTAWLVSRQSRAAERHRQHPRRRSLDRLTRSRNDNAAEPGRPPLSSRGGRPRGSHGVPSLRKFSKGGTRKGPFCRRRQPRRGKLRDQAQFGAQVGSTSLAAEFATSLRACPRSAERRWPSGGGTGHATTRATAALLGHMTRLTKPFLPTYLALMGAPGIEPGTLACPMSSLHLAGGQIAPSDPGSSRALTSLSPARVRAEHACPSPTLIGGRSRARLEATECRRTVLGV